MQNLPTLKATSTGYSCDGQLRGCHPAKTAKALPMLIPEALHQGTTHDPSGTTDPEPVARDSVKLVSPGEAPGGSHLA